MQLSSYQFIQQLEDEEVNPYEARINNIVEIDEERMESHQRHLRFREKLKKLFYKQVTPRTFHVGDILSLIYMAVKIITNGCILDANVWIPKYMMMTSKKIWMIVAICAG